MPNAFDTPTALLLLLALPAYWYWYTRTYEKKRLVIRLSYDPTQLHKPRWNMAIIRYIPLALQTAAMACFILALARPQTVSEQLVRKTDGIDMMLLLDVSESMGTEDILPSRLEAAKIQASQFVKGRFNDRIGIVLFAEEALGYAPLTLDYPFLEELLNRVHFDMLPKRGTAVGNAIAVGLNRMEDSKSKSKAMLLITDGVANRGQIDPTTAARLAKLNHVRIYCIGVGQDEFMERTATGAKFAKSDLDEATLKKVASLTGGKYFRAKEQKALERIFEDISAMETTEMNQEIYRQSADHYPIFIVIGLVLLVAAYGLMLTFAGNPLEQ